jgi:shikimate dehydrogenase
MKIFGLIGYPLEHSFSQKYFNQKFKDENISNCEYRLFPINNINQLESIINDKNILGLNVTIPYKEQIIKYLDKIDDVANDVGAVNTIKIEHKDGKTLLIGFNTDIYGFEKTLIPILNKSHKKALILGTGGAAKAVKYVLLNLGMEVISVSRKQSSEINTIIYEQLNREIIENSTLIVNTTPVGMFPNINELPNIPYEYLTPEHILYDLIYNPNETLFIKKGREKNTKVINGLQMLILQAEKSWKIWNK